MTNEAFARVKIDALLAAQAWNTQDPNAVRYEVVLPDSTRADYVLCDRNGRSLAVIEAHGAPLPVCAEVILAGLPGTALAPKTLAVANRLIG